MVWNIRRTVAALYDCAKIPSGALSEKWIINISIIDPVNDLIDPVNDVKAPSP
jgi:hypothetical protein